VQNEESDSAVARDVSLLTLGFVLLLVYGAVVLTRTMTSTSFDPLLFAAASTIAVYLVLIAVLPAVWCPGWDYAGAGRDPFYIHSHSSARGGGSSVPFCDVSQHKTGEAVFKPLAFACWSWW